MNKFDTCKLSDLKQGDRFYFSAKKNNVCEFCGSKKEGFETTYCYFDHNEDIVNTTINRKTIYLRNIND